MNERKTLIGELPASPLDGVFHGVLRTTDA
jgi:hypothetical protein